MNEQRFEVRCNAGPEGRFQVKSNAISVGIGHPIANSLTEEMWQSLIVISERSEDGTFTTKVIVCHPDWDQNLQIACIRSAPGQVNRDALEIDLRPTNI